MQATRSDTIFTISALNGEGLDRLLSSVAQALDDQKTTATLTLQFSDGKRRAWLHEAGVVENERQTDTGFTVEVRWTDRQAKAWRDL